MHSTIPYARLFCLSLALVGAFFLFEGNKGLNLWDESFLWYGAQRVLQGEIPIRDFMAYDPGRYYGAAAVMALLGDPGILALRLALAVFQCLGLFLGLCLIAGAQRRPDLGFAALAGLTLIVWSFFPCVFDLGASVVLLGALTYLVRRPTARRYLLAGVCVGLIAIFGRNHGVYGALASLGTIFWLHGRQPDGPGTVKGLGLWLAGVVIGYAPLLCMLVALPGFAPAFWDSIRLLFEIKGTNLPLPVPWPWETSFGGVPLGQSLRRLFIGLYFLGLPLFGLVSLGWIFWRRRRGEIAPALVAAAFLSLPYAHYAYSRADVIHLALGLYPACIGCFVALANLGKAWKWPLAALLLATSFWAIHGYHAGWQYLTAEDWVDVTVSGNTLHVDPATAADIALLQTLRDTYAPHGENVYATWPGAYAVLGLPAPTWEIYALFPHAPAFEQTEIKRLEAARPSLVFLCEVPSDRHNDVRFQTTHPLLYQYITSHFAVIPETTHPACTIYRANQGM